MSYRIDYMPATDKMQNQKPSSSRAAILTVSVFTAFLVAVHSFFPQGWDLIENLLWPGNAQVTQQALELLVDDLRAGESLSCAADAFCREIITNADIP